MKAAISVITLSILTPVFIYGAEEILFQDNFTKVEAGWPATTKGFSVKDGKLVMEVEPDSASLFLNRAHSFQDISASIDAQMVSGGIHTVAGLAFWATDYKNYWAVLLSNGTLGVFRYINDERQVVSDWETYANVKKNFGETNSLKVTIRGDQVAVNVNGKDLVSFKGFKGTPPEGGGAIGVKGSCESGGTAPCTITFSNLKVTK